MARREMTHLMASETEAQAALQERRRAMISSPPMYPITGIRVERRLIGKADDPDKWRWVVAGDYSAWPG